MNNVDKNIQSIPKLLRVMAKTPAAIQSQHNIIFNEAANLIDHLAKIREKAKQIIEEENERNVR